MRTFYLGIMMVAVAHAVVLDRVAVVVGTDVITESEVIEELRLDEFLNSQPLDLSPQRRREAAARMVDQQLIRQEMQVAQFQPPPPTEADAMLRNFKQQHFSTEADYRAALRKYGITENELKQHLLWQLSVIRFTDVRFGAAAPPAAEASANRELPPGTPSPSKTPAQPDTQSADRAAPGTGSTSVDERLDQWLKQARGTTKVSFKQEAFQ